MKNSSITSIVYTHIKDKEYDEAIQILHEQLQVVPRSRAALSLLAYCYYHKFQFDEAASHYERLVKLCPNVDEYRIYWSQSLLQAGAIIEAKKTSLRISNTLLKTQSVLLLKASIYFEENDLLSCKSVLTQCVQEDPDTLSALGTIAFQEGSYSEALDLYINALNMIGYDTSLAYNISLCHFKLQQYDDAFEIITEIIARGLKKYPNLSSTSSVLDTTTAEITNKDIDLTALEDSFLIESYNLKLAIEYERKNIDDARKVFFEMPQRNEDELDPISLHNHGLIFMDDDTTNGLKKLNFLLSHPPFPPETFGNLLLLYCKYGYHHLAADILAENAQYSYELITQDTYDFLDTSIMISVNSEEAAKKLDLLLKTRGSVIRKLKKDLSVASTRDDKDEVKSIDQKISDELLMYIPVLMALASIYWEREDYVTVESVLRQNSDICGESNAWKLNAAHTFFMQQGVKFADAIKYYEPFVKGLQNNILSVTPIILANLCVAYIMTNQNEEAEDLIKLIEKEEQLQRKGSKQNHRSYHGCIVNLVIGTLYCEKGNYEFGISRICKSLEPYDSKVSADTWFYAKRCLLALADNIAKNMLSITDDARNSIFTFLDNIEKYGASIPSVIGTGDSSTSRSDSTVCRTVSQEAKYIKNFLIQFSE